VTTNFSALGVPKEHRSKVLDLAEGGTTTMYDHWKFNPKKKVGILKWMRKLH
jgi:hypothetical protein